MVIRPYGGWQRCAWIAEGKVEAVCSLEVGPRVIRYGFIGENNVFGEMSEDMGKREGSSFRLYGGHRFWLAPEVEGRTDFPDNALVEARRDGEWQIFTAPMEPVTFLQKEIRLRIVQGVVVVEHRVYNHGLYAVEVAPWAITVLRPGGVALLPQEPFQAHSERLAPVRLMALWGYTDMSDARWKWGSRLIRLRQTEATSYQKIGALVTAGWSAYWVGDMLFVKRFPYEPEARYPDFGCNAEMFVRHDMLELESLGPLCLLKPKAYLSHWEQWALVRPFTLPEDDHDAYELLRQVIDEISWRPSPLMEDSGEP
ncbi:MAG: hypothetical protein QXI19_10035 [Candidatus Caldarchaeum sp.]